MDERLKKQMEFALEIDKEKNVFIITCHHFFIKWSESIPCISSAFSIRKHSIVNGFLRALKLVMLKDYSFTQVQLYPFCFARGTTFPDPFYAPEKDL